MAFIRSCLVPALVVIGLGWSLPARADKVDWSQYIEPAGYKTPGAPVAKPATKATPAPAAAAPAKQVKKKAPTKAPKLARAKKPKH